MAVGNSIVKQEQNKPAFSAVINSVPYQKLIANTLKDRSAANRFVSSIVSAVATTPALQDCTPKTVISAALLGEALKLSPSPQLGQFYMVPFKQKEKKDRNGRVIQEACTNATFVLGYKGYVQLATRSGEYKHINAMPIKSGELIRYNPFDDDIELQYIDNEELREQLPTVGYYAMFEYHNGFRKVLYWSREKMISHAAKYSPAFTAEGMKLLEAGKVPANEMWKYSSFWYKDFDGMACKTMLRQLISKWGLMSVDMTKAYEADGGIIGENGEVTFAEPEAEQAAPQQQPGNIIDADPVQEPEPEAPVMEAPAEYEEPDFAELMGG
jgi:recombination protein RecT